MNYKKAICVLLVLIMALCLFPVNALADDPDPTMNPKQTNELYEGLIDGFSTANFSDELKGIDFDNSALWGVFDWTRALLITSLCQDLKENNESIYNRYVSSASKYYMALVPPLFNKDDPYSYQILLLDETDALSFYYTPGFYLCSYSEVKNITQENIENLSILASIVWEVTAEDFASMDSVIENGLSETAIGSTVQAAPSVSPTASPKPKVALTRSEIEDKAGLSLYVKLLLAYSNYNLDATGFRIDSVIESYDGWDVKGIVILYDYRNNASSHTFRVHIDSNGDAGICDIR